MSTWPPQSVLACYLAEIGITPEATPAEFDLLGREFAEWWEQGGSMRGFVDAHRGDRQRSAPLTPAEARRALEKRFLDPWQREMLAVRERYESR